MALITNLASGQRAGFARGSKTPWLLPAAAVRGGLGVLAALILLEAASRSGLLPAQYFPPVSLTFLQLLHELTQATLWVAVGQTMAGWAAGLLLAVVVAVPAGLLIGSVKPLFHASRIVVEFLRPIPSVALVPLAVLVFGAGLEMKVFLVVFACTWPLLFQTMYGVRDVDPTVLATARVYGLPAHARFVKVVLPSAMPYIATGLRISAAIGLILAVTAEIVVGAPGIGRLILDAQSVNATTTMYALVAVTGLLGLLINLLVRLIEKRVLAWHVSVRGVTL
jgi:ABC-type nitrate/sulfonate/bicarbonate transport system permease component